MDIFPNSYDPSWIAELFHSFPHVDLTFAPVNSTFDLQDQRYKEVKGFMQFLLSLVVFIKTHDLFALSEQMEQIVKSLLLAQSFRAVLRLPRISKY